jgi:monoterpene epsilon-lactone hydrolase
MSNADQPGILLPERFIPIPSSISPEAQAFLSHKPPVSQTEHPALEDKAGWRAHAAEANRQVLAFGARNITLYPAETVTHQLSACPLYEVVPNTLAPENEHQAILYIHGGGFFMGGGQAAINSALPFAALARTRTYSLDYRMPPDHPFPAALDDAIEAYRWLLERYRSERIAVYGPSAGGNLAAAVILKARDLDLPLPAACAVHSPCSDCTESGDSYETNAVLDIILQHRFPQLMALYADGHDLTDPLLSPLFANYAAGFAPTLLSTGTRDLLLSSTVLLHRAMRRGGVKAELHVWEAMTHAPFFNSPEERELLDETIRFLLEHIAGH